MPAQYTLLYTTGIFHSSTVCLLFSGSGDYQAVQAYQAQRWLPPAVGWSGEYALQEDHLVVRAVAARISLSGPWHPCVIVYHCPDCGIPRIIVRCADCGIPYTPGLCERNSENYYTLLNRHLFCLAYRVVHGGPQKKLRSTRVFQIVSVSLLILVNLTLFLLILAYLKNLSYCYFLFFYRLLLYCRLICRIF